MNLFKPNGTSGKYAYLFQFIYFFVGILILLVFHFLGKGSWIKLGLLVACFGLGYFFIFDYIEQKQRVRKYILFSKSLYLVPGLVAGMLVQFIPCLIYGSVLFPTGVDLWANFYSISFNALAVVFLSVLWEELWFRNAFLNLETDTRRRTLFSLFNGMLFMVFHLLNSGTEFFSAPELLMGGAVRTLSYYSSESFYLPFGLHLGSNITAQILRHGADLDTMQKLDSMEVSFTRAGVFAVLFLLLILWEYQARHQKNDFKTRMG